MSLQLSKAWKCVKQHQVLYTGGLFLIDDTGNIAFCSCEDIVNLVDLESGTKVAEISSEGDPIITFAIHSSSQRVATSHQSGIVRIWSIDDTFTVITEKRHFKAHDVPVNKLSFDSTGNLLVSGAIDRTVRVWDTEKGFCTHNFKSHPSLISSILFHPFAERLLLFIGCDDGSLFAWDLKKNTCSVVHKHLSSVTAIVVVDTDFLLTSGRDKIVNLTEIRESQLKHVKAFSVYESLENLISIDRKGTFLTAGNQGNVKTWSFANKKFTNTGNFEASKTPIECIQYVSSKSRFVFSGIDHNLHLHEIPSFNRHKLIVGFNDQIIDLKFIPGENRVTVVNNSSQFRIFDLDSFDAELLSAHDDVVLGVDVSFDGKFIASVSKDCTVKVWARKESGFVLVFEGRGHTEAVTAVCFPKRSNEFIITASCDRTIKKWILPLEINFEVCQQLECVQGVLGHQKDINMVAIAPNDSVFASASQDKTIKLWSTSTLEELKVFKGHKRGVWSIAFSPVDKCIASASGDKTIKIWSLKDSSCLKTFEGHTSSVLSVQFLTSGMQLMSSGADGLLKLWTIKTNECIATYDEPHEERIWCIRLSKDEKTLIAGGADSVLSVWTDNTVLEAIEESETQQQFILKDQELSNALKQNDYEKAMQLALELDHPRRLYGILEVLFHSEKGEDDIQMVMESILRNLDTEQLSRCFAYIREWNTKARRSEVAQTFLKIILCTFSIDQLKSVPRINEFVEGIFAYSKRHYERVHSLLQRSYVLDFIAHSSKSQSIGTKRHYNEIENSL